MTSKARAKSWHISSLDGLKPSELEKIAYGLSELQAEVALHDWLKHARPEQIAPDGDWAQWLFLVEVPARREQARSGFARYDEADTIRDFILELKKLWSKLAHWSKHARPEQLAPDGDWAQWLFLAGRGAGKTRAGSEWVRSMVLVVFPGRSKKTARPLDHHIARIRRSRRNHCPTLEPGLDH